MSRPLPQLLAEIDALLAKFEASQSKASYADYRDALQNGYPQLREAAQDRERMREALERVIKELIESCDVADLMTDEAAEAIEQARAALARKEG